jgi:signal transduction histidine kinase
MDIPELSFYFKYFKNILDSSHSVLKNMMNAVRFNADGDFKMLVNNERFAILPFVQQCITLFDPYCDIFNKNCVFVGENLHGILVYTDRIKLGQIIYNLIYNAFIHGRRESQLIEILLMVDSSSIKMSITNESEPIVDEEALRIFELFHQSDAGEVGSGIGLYLCKYYISLLGGSIEVISADGKVTFQFCVPLTTE